MLNTILETLKIMGWLGLILLILTVVNTSAGIFYNLNNGEKFDYKKLLKGFAKVLIFYISAMLTSIAFAILPFINIMITNTFNVGLLSDELLKTMSSTGILSIVIAAIISQATNALENIKKIAEMGKESN